MTAKPDLSVHLSPPPFPQFQRPHRLRCFTQPMKCLKDTESVSGHGLLLSAGLPEGCPLSTSVPCMHSSSSSAWIHTEYGSPVAPMYNPVKLTQQVGSAPRSRWSLCHWQDDASWGTCLDCTWTLLARIFLFHPGPSLWEVSFFPPSWATPHECRGPGYGIVAVTEAVETHDSCPKSRNSIRSPWMQCTFNRFTILRLHYKYNATLKTSLFVFLFCWFV